MADLTITGHVTRPIIGGGNLAIANTTYELIGRDRGFGPGALSWRRNRVESPYSHGAPLISAVKDIKIAPLDIRVTGSSETDCFNKMATLLRAFEQIAYQLSLTFEGTTFTYNCEPADYSVGNGGWLQEFHLMQYKQEVRLQVPHHPTPVAGPA